MINKVILIGTVGQDPDVKYLDGGIAVARLSIATNERYKNKNGETVDQTEWHNIVFWRGLAETIEKYVTKGMRIYIEGRLRNRNWEKDGIKHYSYEIQADTMQMLTPKNEGGSTQKTSQQQQEPQTPLSASPEETDLPF